MADKRFPWGRVSNLEALYELKSRNIHHPLAKDSGLKCIAEGCRRYCRRGEDCYLPTYNPGQNNQIVAHFECVAAATRQDVAKQVRQAQVAKGILHPPKLAIGEDLKAFIERIRKAAYEQGFSEGRQAIMAELSGIDPEDPEWTH